MAAAALPDLYGSFAAAVRRDQENSQRRGRQGDARWPGQKSRLGVMGVESAAGSKTFQAGCLCRVGRLRRSLGLCLRNSLFTPHLPVSRRPRLPRYYSIASRRLPSGGTPLTADQAHPAPPTPLLAFKISSHSAVSRSLVNPSLVAAQITVVAQPSHPASAPSLVSRCALPHQRPPSSRQLCG